MGALAVSGDHKIIGQCIHQIPVGNASGPMTFPFSAPITDGLVASVLIKGAPAAVEGSSGATKPAHPGLHPSDQFFEPSPTPRKQVGKITKGSSTVSFGGHPAASIASIAQCCRPPGKLAPGEPTVEIG